jgi:hypothetical protein
MQFLKQTSLQERKCREWPKLIFAASIAIRSHFKGQVLLSVHCPLVSVKSVSFVLGQVTIEWCAHSISELWGKDRKL